MQKKHTKVIIAINWLIISKFYLKIDHQQKHNLNIPSTYNKQIKKRKKEKGEELQ